MYCFSDDMIDPSSGKAEIPYERAAEYAVTDIDNQRKDVDWTNGSKLMQQYGFKDTRDFTPEQIADLLDHY